MKEAFEKIRKQVRVLSEQEFCKRRKQEECDMYFDCETCLIDSVIQIVSEVEAEYINKLSDCSTNWIPCSERYPNKEEYLKNDGRFIVTDGHRVYQSIYDIYINRCFRTPKLFNFLSGRQWEFEIDNCVIAWMPLPEPWKGEQG